MRGNGFCLRTWQRPDRRRQLRQGLLYALLGLVLLGAASLVAQQPAPAAQPADAAAQPADAAAQPADAAANGLEAQARRLLQAAYPGIDVAAMLEYYSRTSPDIHAEVRTRLADGSEGASTYLGRLAEHYLRLDRVRERNPTEFDRLLALDLLESRARMLGRLVRQLSSVPAEGGGEDAAAAQAAAGRAKDELRGVLERAFEGTQQNQRIELNRLDAELRTMRRLLDERASKRDQILRQRFLELCGQELATPPAPPVVENDTPAP